MNIWSTASIKILSVLAEPLVTVPEFRVSYVMKAEVRFVSIIATMFFLLSNLEIIR
jgi:hypothetical protein